MWPVCLIYGILVGIRRILPLSAQYKAPAWKDEGKVTDSLGGSLVYIMGKPRRLA